MSTMSIKVALIGIGNTASILLQGLHYYKNNDNIEGLWHPIVGNYKVSDIEVVDAYDIDPTKIGLDLSNAAYKNNCIKYVDLQNMDIDVKPGLLADNIPRSLKQCNNTNYDRFVDSLKSSNPDIVINLISSGLDNTTKLYAEGSLISNANFINTTNTNLVRTDIAIKYEKAYLMLIGDDLMSQFGGTAFHKGIINFMNERGIKIEKSYQLDVGGSNDTLNTLDEQVKEQKSKVKTKCIDVEANYKFESIAGTTEYTNFLNDNRVSYYWIKSKGFMNAPITIDITLRTNDGVNGANVLLDVIRAIMYCKKNNIKHADIISSYGFKNPPYIMNIQDSYNRFVETFVNI